MKRILTLSHKKYSTFHNFVLGQKGDNSEKGRNQVLGQPRFWASCPLVLTQSRGHSLIFYTVQQIMHIVANDYLLFCRY